MNIYDNLINKKSKMAIVGLGYVGMPLLLEFSKKINVIGYDIDVDKIENYKKKYKKIKLTSTLEDIKNCNCFIIAVPTPINNDNSPDLTPLVSATKSIGTILKSNSIVIYESTVYPNVTEVICKKILESESNLEFNKDFFLGYSPERINPGDKKHKLVNITKIISGSNKMATKYVENIYKLIIDKVHVVSNIKTAETIKLIENTQRDLNIALMNEFSFICRKENIDIYEVIEGASTKWNFYRCYPGLVGGHCIGIDPYYYIYFAKQIREKSDIVEIARKTNENMVNALVEKVNEALKGVKEKQRNILILGITYKPNTTDTRNSKIIEIINKLKSDNKNNIMIVDSEEVQKSLNSNFKFIQFEKAHNLDLIIFGSLHNQFKKIKIEEIRSKFRNQTRIIELGSYFKKKVKGMVDYYWNL